MTSKLISIIFIFSALMSVSQNSFAATSAPSFSSWLAAKMRSYWPSMSPHTAPQPRSLPQTTVAHAESQRATPAPVVLAAPAPKASSTLNGSDVSDLIAYFRSYVHILNRPIDVYNWINVGNTSYYQQSLSLHDNVAYRRAVRSALSYWINFTGDNGTGMFGYGLYAAIDPGSTQSYGGEGSAGWLLTEMHLPIGFRVVDMIVDTQDFSDDIQQRLQSYGCDSSRISELLRPYGKEPNCVSLIKKIFQENLRIDGFVYDYSINSPICTSQSSDELNAALVITSNRWMTPQAVSTYVPNMRDGLKERVHIASLLNLKDAQASTVLDGDFQPWADLKTQSVEPNLKAWIDTHLLGCGDSLPYAH